MGGLEPIQYDYDYSHKFSHLRPHYEQFMETKVHYYLIRILIVSPPLTNLGSKHQGSYADNVIAGALL